MKYANLYWQNNELDIGKTRAVNIGDYLQFMAIDYLYSMFLPKNEEIIRFTVNDMKTYRGEKVILPLNWSLFDRDFCDGNRIAISEDIIPVFLAMTVQSWQYRTDFLNEYNLEYLKRFEPIGCRDEYTKQLLLSKGVKAYLNGCMTTVFPRLQQHGTKVLFVDVPVEVLPFIPKEIVPDGFFSQQYYYNGAVTVPEIIKKIEQQYEYYRKYAGLVVTSRLHVASPCMAAGIPVVFIKNIVDARFDGFSHFLKLYDKDMYSEIDWSPVSMEYEEEKRLICENGIRRIQSAGKDCALVEEVDKLLSVKESKEYPQFQETIYSGFDKVKEYLKLHFAKTDAFCYGIWGLGQAAENLYLFMRENYPQAKLTSVLDTYRTMCFHGVNSEIPANYHRRENEVMFVLPVQASNMAGKVLLQKGYKTDEFVCAGQCFITE